MAENYGKKFEQIVKTALENVEGVSIDRVHDQMSGFSGSRNICDFIVYKKPYEVYIECKTVHGTRLSFSNITENQWSGLVDKSKIKGVFAGILCWWVDYNVTLFIPIQLLEKLKIDGEKSIKYDPFTYSSYRVLEIKGKKKRVFYDYDFSTFIEEVASL